jgi:hypothetical protein
MAEPTGELLGAWRVSTSSAGSSFQWKALTEGSKDSRRLVEYEKSGKNFAEAGGA